MRCENYRTSAAWQVRSPYRSHRVGRQLRRGFVAFVAEYWNCNLRPGLVPVRRRYVALASSPWPNGLAHRLSILRSSLRIAALLSIANTAHAATLTVGTGQMYDKPSQAFAAAKDGDTVRVYSETYTDDFAVIARNGLHIEGVNGRPLIKQSSTSVIPNGKALWVIDGTQITVKNFEFSNAHCDNNCEGIRVEAAGTVILDSSFHHNEFGLLSAALPNVSVDIENSEFYQNGGAHTLCHQIYIAGESLTFKYNYVHAAPCDGHLLKTRAQHNYILYNRITAEKGDQSSYQIDVPVGGETYVIGNIIEKGVTTNNPSMLAYDEEGAQGINPANPIQAVYIVNNTMVNDGEGGTFILQANSSASTQITNNLFVGPGGLVFGAPLGGGKTCQRDSPTSSIRRTTTIA